MKPLVYVAAPYTNPDPVENTHRAVTYATRLYEEGYCTPFVPHLTLAWHLVTPRPVEFWYQLDHEYLARCDAVVRLTGGSSGADAEVEMAFRLGIPVFSEREVAELRDFCRNWHT